MKFRFAALATMTSCLFAGAAVRTLTLFTVSSRLPPAHTLSQAQRSWCAALEKESTGRMKCNILPKGVVAAPGTFDAVRDGQTFPARWTPKHPAASSTPRWPSFPSSAMVKGLKDPRAVPDEFRAEIKKVR